MTSAAAPTDNTRMLKVVGKMCYTLQALGLFFIIPWIPAAMVSYAKMNDVRGTWFESHFRAQMQSSWVFLGMCAALWLIWLSASSLGVFSFAIIAVAFAAGWFWVAKRVVGGFVSFHQDEPFTE
jgi:uncharacterized membrane protein